MRIVGAIIIVIGWAFYFLGVFENKDRTSWRPILFCLWLLVTGFYLFA